MDQFGADAVGFLYYPIAHLKKIYNGLNKGCLQPINLFKNFGYYTKELCRKSAIKIEVMRVLI